MKLLSIAPLLTVTNMQPAIVFYRDTLGFKCLNATENWACMGLDGIEIMLALPNAHLPFERPVLTGSIYLATDDADGWWELLKEKCEIVYPIETFDYGMREFAIRDNSGYLLQFGTRL